MKKIIAFILSCVMVFTVSTGCSESNTDFVSFDFDLSLDLLWQEFPEECQELVKGYADFFELARLYGTAGFELGGNYNFDLDLHLAVKDRKEAETSIHLYGYDGFCFFTAPMFDNEDFYFYFPMLMMTALKLTDFFDFPFHDIALFVPQVWICGMKEIENPVCELVAKADADGYIDEEAIHAWNEEMTSLYEGSEAFRYWLDGIGLQSGLNEDLKEELESISLYSDSITCGNGLQLIRGENSLSVLAGNRILYQQSRNSDGSEENLLLLPATPLYGYRSEIKSLTGEENSTLTIAVGKQSENDVLGMKVQLENVSNGLRAGEDFSIKMDLSGRLKGNGHLRLDGIWNESTLTIHVYNSFGDLQEMKEVMVVDLSISGRNTEPFSVYEKYILGTDAFDHNIVNQNEQTLSELIGRITGSMIREWLPIFVQTPASTCKNLMDFMCDHGIVSFLTGGASGADFD